MKKLTKQLAIELQNGDQKAAHQLFSLLRKPLFGYLYRLTTDKNIAEDILQETLIKIYSGLKSYNSDCEFMPWAYAICRNCFLQLKRQQQKIIKLNISENNFENDLLQQDFSDSLDISEDVKTALNQLSEPVKESFILKHFQNLTFQQVANLQEIPVPTVKSRVLFALKKIRAYMARGENLI